VTPSSSFIKRTLFSGSIHLLTIPNEEMQSLYFTIFVSGFFLNAAFWTIRDHPA